uniref:Uncharacterized protein n=1 Tax=Vitis vinifera TaxID=29760 RepID=A5BUW0_VITVI|nr:hypothetical protein VITISV_041125 [Vitis vinifera]
MDSGTLGCTKRSKVRSEARIGPQSLPYGFLNEIMDHPCSDEGPKSDRMGCTKFNEECTKFNEGCTKFCEGCTKGSIVSSKVGIGSQSLPYGFQNEIMNHPCSDGGPESNRFGCTKFNERCTKFCEGCTKGSKVRFEVGVGPQSLPYGFQNEIMDHPCSDGDLRNNKIGCTKFNERYTKFCERCTKGSKMGVPEAIGWDVQKFNEECTKFNEGCTKFCEGCTKGSKSCFEMRVKEAIGFGCTKFNEECTKFCEGCTKGSKVRFKVGIGPQSLPYEFLNEIVDHPCSDGGPESDRIGCIKFNEGCSKFCEGCTKGSKVRFKAGIGPQSLSYGFLNEIMGHPCSDGGPESDTIGCTKFNEGCTKFCEECTKGSKVCFEVGIGPQTLSYGFKNEIMDHPCSDRGPISNRIGCTKFWEGYTKGCKVRFKVGIGPQSLPYRFLNEIMDHSCSDGGPEGDRIGCTKFNEGCTKFNEGCTKFNEECTKFNEECTKFCEECTKGSKVRFKVGIGPQSLSYGFLNEIMDHPCSDGGTGSDRIGCTKFNGRCTKFCEGCTKGSKVAFRGGDQPPITFSWVSK